LLHVRYRKPNTNYQIFVAVFGPGMFLFAESLGCNISEEDERDCKTLTTANFLVTLQLLASSGLYLCTEISTLHLSYEDTVALRNVDAGYVFRLLAQAATWVCAPLERSERAQRK
jgi:hypothetical protein